MALNRVDHDDFDGALVATSNSQESITSFHDRGRVEKSEELPALAGWLDPV